MRDGEEPELTVGRGILGTATREISVILDDLAGISGPSKVSIQRH